LGKKSAPPPAPDYTAAANATAASNQQAQTHADYTNRPTINTPFGQESWKQQAGVDPATGQAVTNWTQNTTLTPDLQKALDAQQSIDMGKSNLALGSMDRLNESYAQPFDWNKLPASATAPKAGALQNTIQNQGPALQGGIDTSNLAQMHSAISGQGVPEMGGDVSAGVGDASRQRVEQGLMARLAPEQDRQRQQLATQLANQGLTPGSAAYNRAQQQQADQFSRDQFNALMQGGQEQQNQFGMANAASQNATQRNAQGFDQNARQAAIANAANAQQFGQNQQQGMFGNQANAQGFQQGVQGADLYNQAQNQGYNQDLSSANTQQQLRQQAIAEQMQQRAMPLNEMNAIMTGTQVGMPQIPSFNASQSSGGSNLLDAAKQQYGAAMNNYNAQQQQGAGTSQALGSVASMAAMAF